MPVRRLLLRRCGWGRGESLVGNETRSVYPKLQAEQLLSVLVEEHKIQFFSFLGFTDNLLPNFHFG